MFHSNKFFSLIRAMLIASFIFSGINSLAIEKSSYKPHLGALLGYANPEGLPKPAMSYGLDFGIYPFDSISVGLQLTHFESKSDLTVISYATLARTQLLLKTAYHVGGDIPFLQSTYAGVKFGTSIDAVSIRDWTSEVNSTHTYLDLAPMVGFDLPLHDTCTVGLEFAQAIIFGTDAADSFSIHLAAKHWF